MSSPWTTLLTAADLDARYALTASLDPAFARREREFYESRSANQLRALRTQAWNCSEGDAYQLAQTYLARVAS